MKTLAFTLLAGLCLTAVPAFAGSPVVAGKSITLAQADVTIGRDGIGIELNDRDRDLRGDRERHGERDRDRDRHEYRERHGDRDYDRHGERDIDRDRN